MKKNIYIQNKKSTLTWLFLSILIIGGLSCKKEWLDIKPEKSLAVPTTIRDFRAMLSSTYGTNGAMNDYYGMAPEVATGEFTVTPATYNLSSLRVIERNAYNWAPDLYGGQINLGFEWNFPYRQIYYTNIVLEGIEKVTPKNNGEQMEWNNVKGSALFFRAFAFYDVARQFCKPYVKSTAASDLGIPLRLQSDFNEVSVRSTVQQTYDQIINDLKESLTLVSVPTPSNNVYKYQPNKAAVYALLARVYLAMSDYENAFVSANSSLNLYSTLFDYNNLTPSQLSSLTVGFPQYFPEVLCYKRGSVYIFLQNARLIPDAALYNLYDANDLRVKAFFASSGGVLRFKGSYDGSANRFTGLATDEVYLIRAECYARAGKPNDAMADLNTLLRTRWKNTVTYQDIIATDAEDALRKVLTERRKELCFRSLRWEDLRRLNQESRFAVTLTRTIAGTDYHLLPNSNSYVFPIPDDVIRLSGIQQNPR